MRDSILRVLQWPIRWILRLLQPTPGRHSAAYLNHAQLPPLPEIIPWPAPVPPLDHDPRDDVFWHAGAPLVGQHVIAEIAEEEWRLEQQRQVQRNFALYAAAQGWDHLDRQAEDGVLGGEPGPGGQDWPDVLYVTPGTRLGSLRIVGMPDGTAVQA
ncbi:hypothetical protein CTZ27_03270 [Streptomyces griseocarneus]|nr:hypothetical protein CTZ27_03270 [Streptomyces griseocarneus]